VRAAPAVSCARMHKEAHTSIQVQRRQSGFPCAMGYGLLRALPGDRAFLPPSSARTCSRTLSASVGAPGPHDFTVRNNAVRRARTEVRANAVASTASRPTFVTTRDPPLVRVRWGELVVVIRPTDEADYFWREGWTPQITLQSLPNLVFARRVLHGNSVGQRLMRLDRVASKMGLRSLSRLRGRVGVGVVPHNDYRSWGRDPPPAAL
jgi:hypothetical protein